MAAALKEVSMTNIGQSGAYFFGGRKCDILLKG